MTFGLTIPGLRIHSEANERCHWAVRRKRFQDQHMALLLAWRKATRGSQETVLRSLTPPLRITLTRVGKRTLDSDNLAGGFKGLRDSMASILGLDDGDPLLEWVYRQRADGGCGFAVAIMIETVPGARA